MLLLPAIVVSFVHHFTRSFKAESVSWASTAVLVSSSLISFPLFLLSCVIRSSFTECWCLPCARHRGTQARDRLLGTLLAALTAGSSVGATVTSVLRA